MSRYINKTTGEYPRHDGDVELSPGDEWVEVFETPFPDEAPDDGYIWVEGELDAANGEYRRTWVQVPAPIIDQRSREIERARRLRVDLELLGVTE
jgi:hypothetical protein